MKDECVQEIIKLLHHCDDLPLLDIIYRLLTSHLTQTELRVVSQDQV